MTPWRWNMKEFYVVYVFWSFYVHLLVVVITGKHDARSVWQMMIAFSWSYSTGKGISV